MMHIPSLKAKTKKQQIEELKAPEFLLMPLMAYQNQMEPLVKEGEYVRKYQLIAKADSRWAARLHAPVSGWVDELVERDGKAYIKLRNDFREQETDLPEKDPEAMTKAELLERIRDYGIEGSGGAGFPSYVKFDTTGKEIRYFILNGAECEPYLSADYALLKHAASELLQTAALLKKLIGALDLVLAIEKQHKELRAVLEQESRKLNIPLKIKLLKNEYPQGGELQLIKAVTGLELAKGSIPSNHGVVVSNVGTIHAIYQAIFEGHPYVERVITVSGEKASRIGNYRIRIGTPVEQVLEQIGMQWTEQDQAVVLGGPMMGRAVHKPEEPVSKLNGGLLVLPETRENAYNCIQCGYCADVCPQRLMPMEFVRYNLQQNTEALERFSLDSCIECGACAYVCPSDVPLMHNIFAGKKLKQKN